MKTTFTIVSPPGKKTVIEFHYGSLNQAPNVSSDPKSHAKIIRPSPNGCTEIRIRYPDDAPAKATVLLEPNISNFKHTVPENYQITEIFEG